mmetsp:Transcript_31858/g.48873  ORF Transcript_31858/g.48873 Transcript_31858/m.48873 type:complete len:393 (-) Transcript_31858:157-1335(-)|eukprot:CAMPEP_0195284912 /NCGR_PEP_ID=MMETSP0707-20130614/2939_1 /TAXON_ID=33640 /ORGANISM="Asterionellopsis glacialis, Strain CCMP134" /LENGTH=392 /DNA_ID=CAMNT_0040344319 /DNA_START=118 /DNA_END=1296 /DNA_ORIENTATION=-
MPPQQDNGTFSSDDAPIIKLNGPAATDKHGRSPTLIKAVPSKYPYPMPFGLALIARITAVMVPSLFYVGPAILAAPIPVALFVSSRAGMIMLTVALFLAFIPVKQWPYFRQFFQMWYELFDFHHNINLPLDPAKQEVDDKTLTIYATHPHGVIPIHGYLWCAFCDQHFPNRYGFGALTDIAMRLPLLRHVMGWLSSEPAQKKVLLRRMDAGDNLYILPGGVAEIFAACPGRNVIKAPRRGLMKLALQTGGVLVPTYVFGANDFYNQLATYGSNKTNAPSKGGEDPTNVLGQIQRKISRRFKGGFTFFWGQYGLPLPYEVKCSMVLGDPIEPVPGTLGREKTKSGTKLTCTKIAEPTEEQIDELYIRYTDALVRLFEQYKAEAGFPDAKLDIL